MGDIIVHKLRGHMRFSYKTIKRKLYRVRSIEVPEIYGEGVTQDDAFTVFLTAFFGHLRKCLKQGIRIADEYHGKASKGTFGLPLNMALKIKLHNVMLDNGITRTTLAQLLALTHEEVPDGDWSLEFLSRLKPENKPKYKNVHRLFDIDHDSTIREIEQAYRVLGYNVSISPYKRQATTG